MISDAVATNLACSEITLHAKEDEVSAGEPLWLFYLNLIVSFFLAGLYGPLKTGLQGTVRNEWLMSLSQGSLTSQGLGGYISVPINLQWW